MSKNEKKSEIENMEYIKYDNQNNVIKMDLKRKVTKTGTGAHIILPLSLIGKYVRVIYLNKQKSGATK